MRGGVVLWRCGYRLRFIGLKRRRIFGIEGTAVKLWEQAGAANHTGIPSLGSVLPLR